jgi:hypothetical protein
MLAISPENISLASCEVSYVQMEPAEAKIKATIEAHFALAARYKEMMTDIENKELFSPIEIKAAEPDAEDRRGIGHHVIQSISHFLVLSSAEDRSGPSPGDSPNTL